MRKESSQAGYQVSLMGSIVAFFHPVSKEEVKASIEDTRATCAAAREQMERVDRTLARGEEIDRMAASALSSAPK